MASTVEPTKAHHDRVVRLLARAAKRPSELGWRSWTRVLRRTVAEFVEDNLTDRAAALTYYGILSMFPGLLVLVAGVGLLGRSTTQAVAANIGALTPGPVREIIANGVENLQRDHRTAGAVAVGGLILAFWSATGYIGAFMRAANVIYDVPEGRPLWKILPIRIAITAVTGAVLASSALAVVLTGRLAEQAGHLLGVGRETVRVFDLAKWPVLVIAFGLLLALLYWAAPNARQGGFRWITPGSLLALTVWVAVSAGFAYYVAHFDSYNRTYGTLGGVIIFLMWLWLTNIAVLLGAEFDAELGRHRAVAVGLPRHAEPYLPLRDLPKPANHRDGGDTG